MIVHAQQFERSFGDGVRIRACAAIHDRCNFQTLRRDDMPGDRLGDFVFESRVGDRPQVFHQQTGRELLAMLCVPRFLFVIFQNEIFVRNPSKEAAYGREVA